MQDNNQLRTSYDGIITGMQVLMDEAEEKHFDEQVILMMFMTIRALKILRNINTYGTDEPF